MPILTKPAFGPQTALAYITAGALVTGWTLVWYFTRPSDHVMSPTAQFLFPGLIVTGLIFVSLGFLLGPIGRAARQAELPPPEALRHEAEIQKAAAQAVPAAAPAAPVAVAAPAAAPAVAAPAAPPGTVLAQPSTR